MKLGAKDFIWFAEYLFVIKMVLFKTMDEMCKSCSKLLILYKVYIQQSQKVPSTEFHRNSPIS